MKKIINSVKSNAVKLKNSFIAFNRRAICGNAGEGYPFARKSVFR